MLRHPPVSHVSRVNPANTFTHIRTQMRMPASPASLLHADIVAVTLPRKMPKWRAESQRNSIGSSHGP